MDNFFVQSKVMNICKKWSFWYSSGFLIHKLWDWNHETLRWINRINNLNTAAIGLMRNLCSVVNTEWQKKSETFLWGFPAHSEIVLMKTWRNSSIVRCCRARVSTCLASSNKAIPKLEYCLNVDVALTNFKIWSILDTLQLLIAVKTFKCLNIWYISSLQTKS